jgi:dihydropteroate synthase
VLRWGERTYIMGVLNLTPDSFSGDGLGPCPPPERVRSRAEELLAAGADFLDLGGESTRPGSEAVPVEEELRRVLPAVEALAPLGALLSIDTWKARVADAALSAGAALVNDVTGLTGDPEMAAVVAQRRAPVIIVHNPRGPHGADRPWTQRYRDLLADIIRWLSCRIEYALAAGVAWENILLDPGVGFAKTAAQNLELLRRLPELRGLGRPLVLGISRKRTIARVLGLPVDAPPHELLEGNAAAVALCIAGGADIVRVHDVAAMARAARMADAIVRGHPAARR